MLKKNLTSQIVDLQNEWATEYPSVSIRSFLRNLKNLTQRQYAFVLEKAPASQWKARREEIQNDLTCRKHEKFANDLTDTLNGTLMGARIAATKVLTRLMDDKPMKPSELLNLVKTLESSQSIIHGIMGKPKPFTMPSIEKTKPVATAPTKVEPEDPRMKQMTYDDIMMLIEIKREQQAKFKGKQLLMDQPAVGKRPHELEQEDAMPSYLTCVAQS